VDPQKEVSRGEEKLMRWTSNRSTPPDPLVLGKVNQNWHL